MALPTFTSFTRILASSFTSIVNHLEGAVGSTAPWHFRQSSGNFQVTMADAAGATKVRFNDSAGVEQFSVDSDGLLIAAALTPTVFTVPLSATPSQTASGSLVYDTAQLLLTVGNGSSRDAVGSGDPVTIWGLS